MTGLKRHRVRHVRSAAFSLFLLGACSQAAMAESWGAIAYAINTGGDGYAFGYDSAEEAKQRAMDECRLVGSGCQPAVWFHNQCGAIAVGFHDPEAKAGKLPDGTGVGLDRDPDIADAEALASCEKTTQHCSIVRSICSIE
ncbi:MAG: DUF4189 domain-containing protein [Hyphomicrobiales bacterium]|nr:DUF4189 domain-containing protein [Hyphomicrobiales bacterium]